MGCVLYTRLGDDEAGTAEVAVREWSIEFIRSFSLRSSERAAFAANRFDDSI